MYMNIHFVLFIFSPPRFSFKLYYFISYYFLESHLIPSGTTIHIPIFDIHRDPNFWPKPNVFNPDRFLPETIKNRHPFSYLPFSAGGRNCIGNFFLY